MVGSRLCKIKITDRDRDGLSSAKIMIISVFNADLRDLNTPPIFFLIFTEMPRQLSLKA